MNSFFREQFRRYFYDIEPGVWNKHLLLFFLTFVTTTFTGMQMALSDTLSGAFLQGLSYSISLMVILTAHEMGHYITAKRAGVDVTLPYFIPLPFIHGFGTLGAFIKMKSIPPGRRELFDIAFWGPAMSFLLSIPVSIAGILLSEVHPIPQGADAFFITYGDSALFYTLTRMIWELPPGYDIFIHPMAFAGWVGFFVTAINLFPISQLDGGHISYAVFGRRHKEVGMAFIILLLLLSLEYTGWIFWIVLLLIMKLRHPPMELYWDVIEPLDRKRVRYALFAFIILIITFIPFPVEIHEPREDSDNPPAIEKPLDNGHGMEFIQFHWLI